MGNLIVSLQNAAGAMRVFERGMSVVQSNVTNASTPGYARQTQSLAAMTFDLDRGLPGGVMSAGTLSSRSDAAEMSVRRQITGFGGADERAQQLARLEPVFDIAAGSGLASSINEFFQRFSVLTVAPNDLSARDAALDQARDLSAAFLRTSGGISSARTAADGSIGAQAAKLNGLLAELRALNLQFRTDYRAQQDAGLDARLQTLLGQIAEIADFTALRAGDGSVSVFLGGQTAVLMGDRLNPISATASGKEMRLVDSEGNEVTHMVSGGRLAGLLDFRNNLLPGYQNEVDRLAGALADTVNNALANGIDMDGNAPTMPLFSYDPSGAGRTLTVNPLAARELALALPGAQGGNGNALVLAALDQQPSIDGATFSQQYGKIAASVGRDLGSAQEGVTRQRSLVAQAREMRDETSRVNLDEEAVTLMAFQRSYQASARMVQTLDEMLETVMSLLR